MIRSGFSFDRIPILNIVIISERIAEFSWAFHAIIKFKASNSIAINILVINKIKQSDHKDKKDNYFKKYKCTTQSAEYNAEKRRIGTCRYA